MTLNVRTAAVRVDGLSRRYGVTRALDEVDLTLERGITRLLGPNGAGKQRLRFRKLLSGLPGDPVIVVSTHQADDIAAICPKVVVLLQGRVHFAGTPAELAAIAAGRIWAADARDPHAYLSWRGGDNRWRHIGDDVPASAELVTPTVENGYLLLSHAAGAQ